MSTALVKARPQGEFLARAIKTPLYDKVAYPAAGALNIAFFAVPAGQAAKTYADTNLLQGGKVGGGQRFYCEGFQISPEQRNGALIAGNYLTIRNDWARIMGVETGAVIAAAQNAVGLFRFGIGSVTSLLTVPVGIIPSGIRATASGNHIHIAATDSAMFYVGNGDPNVDEMLEFKMVTVDDRGDPEAPNIIKRRWQLMSDETFNCSLEYHQGLVPLAAALLNLIVSIPGVLVRAL